MIVLSPGVIFALSAVIVAVTSCALTTFTLIVSVAGGGAVAGLAQAAPVRSPAASLYLCRSFDERRRPLPQDDPRLGGEPL